jgi:hypothetical protein
MLVALMGFRAPVVTALLVAWVCGCAGDSPPVQAMVDPVLHLVAEPESVGIQPSQSKDVRFRLLDPQNHPVPERVLQFFIVDDRETDGDDAAGATLSYDRGVTNADGAVTLQIIAGPTMTRFIVRGEAARTTPLDVEVIVTAATLAPAELVPVLIDAPVPGREVTTVRLYILDDGACAQVRFDSLPAPMRSIPSDSSALFSTISTAVHHPIVAVGLDAAGVARAAGCIDLPGGLLLVDVPLRVEIPMHVFRVAPEGSYDVTSSLSLAPGLIKSATVVTEAWTRLGSCPLDPVRLWLDCTIDALVSSDTDPSDCRPGDDEGPLGGKLLARRGVPVAMPGTPCTDVSDASGRPSHDVLAGSLFPAPQGPLLAALPRLGDEVRGMLGLLELRSAMTITATSTPGLFSLDHALTFASFPLAVPPQTVPLYSLGAPVLEAPFVPVLRKENDNLEIGTHGFTLRLGTTARLAFTHSSLASRGAPADPGAFVAALFAGATRNENGTTLNGCAALDALLCPDVGEARGCLLAACATGLAALQHSLDAGFAAMDGEDIDFVLQQGAIQVIDTDGNGAADALGRATGHPGTWSGEVRGRGGPGPVTGTWTATRVR